MMKKEEILTKVKQYVYQEFHGDVSGHDYYHMQRVARMAKYLAEKEQGDPFICEIAAWVHDIGDDKLTSNPEHAITALKQFLASITLSTEQIETIIEIIANVSFRKGKETTSLSGEIVQDADRLDAIGAIGIARTFAYGGSKNRPLHAEGEQLKQEASIQHFHDKLLKIKDQINTESAKLIATERHAYMEQFLHTFYQEWDSSLI